MWLRLCRLADRVASSLVLSSRTVPASKELRRALHAAVESYYRQQKPGSSNFSGGVGITGDSIGSGSSKACQYMIPRLEAALSASLREHPAVAYPTTSGQKIAQPEPELQYRPLDACQLPELSRSTNYGGLPAQILRELESASRDGAESGARRWM